MSQVISKFEGEYEFLSNFYPSKIIYDIDDGHIIYAPTVEHAFQAAKTINWLEEPDILTAPTPGKAKRLGRKCELRKDWEEVKDNVMRKFLCKKFAIPELRQKLLDTGDAYLIEGTTWHDNYWGICTCDRCGSRGQNKLGQLLMEIRRRLEMDWCKIRNSDDLEWWEKDDIDSILEEYPEVKNMSRHELMEFKTKLYWESQHLIEEANRIESYSDTLHRVIDITV